MKIAEIEKTALIYHDRRIQFSEIHGWVDAFAGLMRLGRGGRVVVFSENRPEWIYALFAAWRLGCTVIPVDALSSAADLAYILGDSIPGAVFVSAALKGVLSEAVSVGAALHPEHIFVFEELNIGPSDGRSAYEPDLADDDVALILYTSGTTGRPKGVMLTRRNLSSNISGITDAGIASRDDVLLSILPLHHAYPLMVTCLIPLFLGATIVMLDKVSSDEILSACRLNKITIFVGVPRVFELLRKAIVGRIRKNPILSGLFSISRSVSILSVSRILFASLHKRLGGAVKYFVSGGARLDPEVAGDIAALGFLVVEGYGLTETSPIVSFNPPGAIRLGSVGRPLQGVDVNILDGEVLVRGPNVMKGYLNHPEKTSEAVRDGWFYTGDAGRLDSDGYLYITGRKKDMIVLPNGKNIDPSELEGLIIAGSPYVKEAAVLERNGRLFCLVHPDLEALRADKVTNINDFVKWEVIDRYNRSVPDYKKIADFEVIATDLPKTRLGKLKRHLIGSLVKGQKRRPDADAAGPSDEIYGAIKRYLEGASGRAVFWDDHMELDLGLDSLGKIELLSFIDKTFGVSVSEEELSRLLFVRDLYDHVRKRAMKVQEGETGWLDVFRPDAGFDIYEKGLFVSLLKVLLSAFFRLYFRLGALGMENLPLPPFIMAPNHQSLTDGFLVISALPFNILKDTYFIATEDYFRSPLRLAVARMAHVIAIDVNRNLVLALRKAAFLLKTGKIVVIFPEGARTRDGGLLPFKKAFAILSKEMGAPVVPVAIDGAFKAYPLGRVVPLPCRITLRFLPPILPAGRDHQAIVDLTRAAIEGELKKTG
ncbi:MAG: AMP-binding protein [Desulfobacteraceae bacterium]|nr:AMP-binding protein [Desulfobacteraceae bacterium]